MPAILLIALTINPKQNFDDTVWHQSILQFSQESPCSIFKIIPNSSHYIMIDQPTVVNKAILKILNGARNRNTQSYCKLR